MIKYMFSLSILTYIILNFPYHNVEMYYLEPRIDKEFIQYVELFESLYGKKVNLPIKFGRAERDILGTCYLTYPRYIIINEYNWNNLLKEQKEMVVLHELGHCILNKEHNDKKTYLRYNNNEEAECPESIMSSYIFIDDEIELCYIPNYLYYLLELVNE